MYGKQTRKISKKLVIVIGTLITSAIIISAGMLSFYMKQEETINIESMANTITINDNQIPYSSNKVFDVVAGDNWNQTFFINSTFSKQTVMYLHNNYTDESLNVTFYNGVNKVTSIIIEPNTDNIIRVYYQLSRFTDLTLISGNITFDIA